MANKPRKITGTSANDRGAKALVGSDDDDDIYGLAGDDDLIGRDGDDWLFPGGGNNLIDGGSNSSYPRIGGPDTRFPLRGVTAGDLVSYFDLPGPIVANIIDGTGTVEHGQFIDTIIDIENIHGSEFDDIIAIDNPANGYFVAPAAVVEGGAGSDIIRGGRNRDIIDGDFFGAKSGGNDELYGFGGDDQLYDSPGNDLFEGGDDFGRSPYSQGDLLVFQRVVQLDISSGIARHGKSSEADRFRDIENFRVPPGSTVTGNGDGSAISVEGARSKMATTFIGSAEDDHFFSYGPSWDMSDRGNHFFGSSSNEICFGKDGSDLYSLIGHFSDTARLGQDVVMDFERGDDILEIPVAFGELDTNSNGVLDNGDKNIFVSRINDRAQSELSTTMTLAKGSSLVLFGVTGLGETDFLAPLEPS